MRREPPVLTIPENEPIGIGTNLVVIMTFDIAGPALGHIETIRSRGNMSELTIVLSDAKLVTNMNTFDTSMQGTGWLLGRGDMTKNIFMFQWNDLKNKYDWDPLVDLIPMVKSSHINGFMVPHASNDHPVYVKHRPENDIESWNWIKMNCANKVWWHPAFWLFESEADAALYKLSAPQ